MMELIEEVVKSYQLGFSLKEVGEQVGISPYKVWSILKDEGVQRRPKGASPKREFASLIVRRYQTGSMVRELADGYGVHPGTVYRILDEANVERRDDRSLHKGGMKRDASRHRRIIKSYLSGLSLKEVGKRFGVSHQRIHEILISNGVARRSLSEVQERIVFSEEDLSRLRSLRTSGATYAELARIMEVGFDVISKCMKSTRDVEIRQREEEWRRWVDLYRSGMSLKEVASEVGVNYTTVRLHVRRAGAIRTISEGKRLKDQRRIPS